MYQIPLTVLQELKCASCHGYLRNSPIMLDDVNAQICGKCFGLVPQNQFIIYRREVGLEAVAKLFKFPCKYLLQGCELTFCFNEENEHESTCSFRDVTHAPDIIEDTTSSVENTIPNPLPNGMYPYPAQPEIYIKNKNKCSLNLERQESVKVEIKSDSYTIVYPRNSPKYTESEKAYPEYENVTNIKQCNYCGGNSEHTIYQNLLGYKMCETCKRNVLPDNIRRGSYICLNRTKGCDVILGKLSIRKHEIECEYNSRQCPADNCIFRGSLINIKQHIKHQHGSMLVENSHIESAVDNSDRTWLLICYGKLFKCIYNFYKTHLEVLVVYAGYNNEATGYKYYVKLRSRGETTSIIQKESNCIGWNEVSLGEGVECELSDIQKQFSCKDPKFNLNVDIIKRM